MPKVTIWFGIILIITGAVGYFGTGESSVTALIPAILGLALLLLGITALREENLKKALHATAILALLGFIGAGMRILSAMNSSKPINSSAFISQLIMTILCAILIGLAVKSFYEVRHVKSK